MKVLAQPLAQEFTPLRAFLWMVGAFFAIVSFALLIVTVLPQSRSDLVGLGASSAAALLLVAALLVGRYPGGAAWFQVFGLRKTHSVAVPLAFLIGLGLQVPAGAVSRAVFLGSSPSKVAELQHPLGTFQAQSQLHSLVMILVIAALVPIAEELFFRGAVYGALRRGGNRPALSATVTSIGFALCHFSGRLLPSLLIVAGVLGLLRATSGSLLPALSAHMAFNSVAALEGVDGFAQVKARLSTGIELVVTLVVLLLLILFVRSVGDHPRARENKAMEGRLDSLRDKAETSCA